MKRRFNKSEIAGLVVLACTTLVVSILYHNRDRFGDSLFDQPVIETSELQEIQGFVQQIKEDSARRSHAFKKKFKKVKELSPFAFDPNTADSNTLAKLGLKNWQISNMLKYRAKGGRWRKPDDFARLYGLSKEEFNILRPFIQIKSNRTDTTNLAHSQKTKRDSNFMAKYPQKFDQLTQIDLNTVDTTTLKRIPGIGSYYAQKICRYRDRLGGFVSVDQIKEVEGLPENIEKWFVLSTEVAIHKTSVNRTDFKGLIRHPYLNYEQVKVICNHIRKYGKIRDLQELSNSEHFTAKDFERLKPYLSYD